MKYEQLFMALLGASAAHAEASKNEFLKLGLSEGQPKILYTLLRYPGIVQKELATKCGVRPSTLTVLLAKVEKKGYIYKKTCYISGGKKAYQIFLTDEGREMAIKLEDVVDDLERRGFNGFSDEQKQQILALLEKVENNMRL